MDYDEQKQDKWSFENEGDPVNPGFGGGLYTSGVQLTFLIPQSPSSKNSTQMPSSCGPSPVAISKTRSWFRSFRNQEKSKQETLKE